MANAHTILMVFVGALLALANTSSIFGHDSEIGLLNYMARANDLLQQDPARSLDCFNKYIPLINQIASNYETNFQACLNESAAASARADDATLQQRDDLANAAEASCSLLQQCPDNEAVEDIFQCYIDGGSANIKTMYTINSNASQELAALREQYYLIRNAEYKCTNDTKRVYEKESAAAYAGLNNCILGNEEVTATTARPTTQPPVLTTSADPQTSENPETTVTVPEPETSQSPDTTSAVPESTESPIPSTENTSPVAEDTTPDSLTTETVSDETTSQGPEENTSENP